MKTCAERMEERIMLLSRVRGYQITIIRRSDRITMRILPGNCGRQFGPLVQRLCHEEHRGGCRWRIKPGLVNDSACARRQQRLRLRYLDC